MASFDRIFTCELSEGKCELELLIYLDVSHDFLNFEFKRFRLRLKSNVTDQMNYFEIRNLAF